MTDVLALLEVLMAPLPAKMRQALPKADEIISAMQEVIEEQLNDYGRILLPRLGIGQEVEIPSQELALPGGIYTQQALDYWQFDSKGQESWLHTALLYPFEHLDDWVVLVRASDLDAERLTQLRPPMIPRLRRTLESLEWLVIDHGGHDGGRLERHEFLDILGPNPWWHIEHNSDQGVVIIKHWVGEEMIERFSARIDDVFYPDYWPWDDDEEASPATLVAEAWVPDPCGAPLETAVIIDTLCDPYATLRRFARQRWGFDIDRLGPGIIWRDRPDELFEFDEKEDAYQGDLGAAIAAHFNEGPLNPSPLILTPLIDQLFEAIVTNLPVRLPGPGELHRIEIPAAKATLRPPSRQRCPAPMVVDIEGDAFFIATAEIGENLLFKK